ncbi:activated Cdc42 kinase-like isoform X2 [Eriocheir sinensis]|uniref:activated Cdc42 kinase-like isoform X2 n=1 Tax=Eriocheir sinensis TaxID=95602 RepID=UPI0021C8B535|nr:activated Cdc42 kinase-like isoform X2 [Eriocheir sinensis]
MNSVHRGLSLYEFLTEAELQHYFNNFKNNLKVQNVGQIKFVADEDLQALGMSRPEIRRLKKYFHKYCPQTYLSKFKKILLTRREGQDEGEVVVPDETGERPSVRVPSKHIIPADAIVINKELGVGEFGVVQQGVWTNEEGERIQVAIKCLSKDRMQTQPMEFLKEASIMHNINSEHIVRLYGVVLDTNALMLVTELAPLRSLLECIKEPSLRVSFPVVSLCHFSIQICDGMSYLEEKRLIHRDLAARNILVFSKNKIKISDFGLSRALGVGKDYYQTNFNVNLKLPIAWCAPECINYLRFTSASDVWAFGVTLWEMFSYGFQPWAALTGQQILEAIDEPNFQRLEQPEACPREYYNIMLKCWQHDALKRPKFDDLMNILPECKPEQVQVVRENEDPPSTPGGKRDRLQYKVGDVITVLDKRPVPDNPAVWKGVLNSGKTGHFSPANTVTYLGTNIPSNKSNFQRGDGKNPYSSRRRLRPEMISGPQGDFKHTGHVGLDGAYFGDVSFLGDKVQDGRFVQKKLDKYHQLPKQIVTPYKPSDDHDQSTSLTRASSDVSDRAPLLKKVGDKGKSGPAAEHNWSDTASEDQQDSPGRSRQADHEYHEISDEEDEPLPRAPFSGSSFDLGPSLMDEVFKALGGSSTTTDPISLDPPTSLPPLTPTHPTQALLEDNETHNVKNELKEIASKITGKDSSKKKQATVKPISAADQRTLDSAIAMANELASKSMSELDCNQESPPDSEGMPDSPITPSSPTKHPGGSRFSFKFSTKGSPKHERRHFSAEAASIPDIQSSISEEAREVYNSLVERPGLDPDSLGCRVEPDSPPPSDPEPAEHNPLRMLRAGVTVRPKIRGNKHNLGGGSGFSTIERSHGMRGGGLRGEGHTTTTTPTSADLSTHQTLPKGFKHSKVPPPVKPKPSPLIIPNSAHRTSSSDADTGTSPDGSNFDSSHDAINLLPLPPRDRTRPTASLTKPRHQRKHPLIIPGGVTNSLLRGGGHVSALTSGDKQDAPTGRLVIQHTHNPQLESHSAPDDVSTTLQTSESLEGEEASGTLGSRLPPAKPPRLFTSPSSLNDSFESQVASEMDALDDIQEEELSVSPPGPHPPAYPTSSAPEPHTPSPDPLLPSNGFRERLGGGGSGGSSLYQYGDHVSCEDLLDFAMDRPNSRRTQGPARGTQSDEVHIMQKVLKNEHVSPEECVVALNECEWDVHRALKLTRLQLLIPAHRVPLEAARSTLASFSWDVGKAASYIVATQGISEDTAQV